MRVFWDRKDISAAKGSMRYWRAKMIADPESDRAILMYSKHASYFYDQYLRREGAVRWVPDPIIRVTPNPQPAAPLAPVVWVPQLELDWS